MKSSLCLLCGRELSNPQSVDRSPGPVCWKNPERCRVRETQGLMTQYEKVGWNYTKQTLAKHGFDVETLFPARGEDREDASKHVQFRASEKFQERIREQAERDGQSIAEPCRTVVSRYLHELGMTRK